MIRLESLTARDNPLLQSVRRLLAHPGGYRQSGVVWVEGEHLIKAAVARGVPLKAVIAAESAWSMHPAWAALAASAPRVALIPDARFQSLSALEAPTRIGALIELPAQAAPLPGLFTVVLDRLQDAGNVGSILRSAAAFGVVQVLALKGTAALWSPKVLRAGMGAHFALRLSEGLASDDLRALRLPLLGTSSHSGTLLGRGALPFPCAWVFGHEGQGVDDALMALCTETFRIPQPGGEESLNVAAAASVCLYATTLAHAPSGASGT